MKKWTVMLIPHDRGHSRTLNLSAYQIWVLVAVLMGLSFTASFFYERHKTFGREVVRLQQIKHDLEMQCAKQASSLNQNAFSTQERMELEQRIRLEYETSLSAITAELGQLYEIENQARDLTGLAPRVPARDIAPIAIGAGKGGGSGALGDTAYEEENSVGDPPRVIYGLSHPSADLIIQEINVRTDSLRDLVAGLEAKKDQVRRLPSVWPVVSRYRGVSSGFGYRKDPFTYRIGHHDGTDVMGPYGASIVATAKGVVAFSQFDGSLGNLIKIDHGNGLETWYAHLSVRLANAGDVVERNTIIGKLGSTGRSTGPHLHYEVHLNGRPVDAAKYLKN